MRGQFRPTPAAARSRPRADLAVPAYAVAAGRLQLPAPADLLGLWRRGDRALRPVGRRMDDAGTALALSSLWHVGHRQCADGGAAWGALVSALALRSLARGQRAILSQTLLRRFQEKGHCCFSGTECSLCALVCVFPSGRKQCAGKSAPTVMTPGRST